MTFSLVSWDYVVIASMLAASLIIGIYFRFTGGRQKTTREFLMAGKDMPIMPVAFSLMATYMSANSLMGIPSEVYMHGTQFASWLIGIPAGSVIAAYVFLPIFFDIEACTAYEYLERRFGKLTRSTISMLFIVQMILYMSIVLYGPSLALNAVTGLSTWVSVGTLAAVCTFYCSLGGLKAVLWTDVLQSFLMYTTLISVIVKASIDIGGLDVVYNIADDGGRVIVNEFSPDLTTRYTFWGGLMNGVLFGVSTFGSNQAQIQRLLSVRSLKRAQWALFASVPLTVVYTFLCFWNGITIYSMFKDCDPILDQSNSDITSQDQLLPYAILTLFWKMPGLPGLAVCGIFSASLSTISSAVNSLTAVTMEDFIRPYCFCKKLTETWAAFIAKIVAILYGGVCILFTIIVAHFRGVLEASNILFGMVGGPVLGIFMLGMLTTSANEQGVLLGLLVGFVFNAWIGFGSFAAQIKIPTLPRSTEGCTPMYNETSMVIQNTTIAASASLVADSGDGEDSDVFALYKISYMWFPILGSLATLVVGYVCSVIIGFFVKKKEIKEGLISPVLRRWYFKSTNDEHKELPGTKNGRIISNGELSETEMNALNKHNHLTNSFAL